jgi:hypothetical protein
VSGVRADTIVGYTYQADLYCPGCIVGQVLAANPHIHSTRLDYATTEGDLDRLANLLAVDRYDEATFDSGDFPKVVFAGMLEGDDRCGKCGGEL